jgi:hypothetical protein
MYPATPPKWVARESEILAAQLILCYLEADDTVREPYLWKIQEDTGIDWVAFEAARRSACLAAEAWRGRTEQVQRILRDRLAELMPA